MTQIKVSLQNSKTWNEKRRYKINDTVTHIGVTYQNTTGVNTEPGTDSNWMVIPMAELANNLTTITVGKALDATQGKILKDLVDLRQVKQSNLVFVQSLSDLPTPSSGTISLSADTTYLFTNELDLAGNKLQASGDCAICGLGSLNSKIYSTGLSTSDYLITTAYSLQLHGISLEHERVLFRSSVSVSGSIQVNNCSFLNSLFVATINNVGTMILDSTSFINSSRLVFTGTSNSIVFDTVSFIGNASGGVLVDFGSLIVNTRFRAIYSLFETTTANAAIQGNASNIPNESFILDTVNFSGTAPTPIVPDYTSNKALILNCKGVENTSTVGFLSMTNNTTVTTQTSPAWTKASGTTTASSINSKFTHANNRLTYTGAFSNTYLASVNANLFAANNGQVLSIGLAKNGSIISESEMTVRYIDGSNPVNASCNVPVLLTTNDYVEVFIRNATSNSNVTVQDMQLLVKKIPV